MVVIRPSRLVLRCREGLILGGVLGVAERGLVMDCIIVMSKEDEKGEGKNIYYNIGCQQ